MQFETSERFAPDWRKQPCFYVSVVDGSDYALLAGPFRTHQEALDRVDATRRVANELDRKSHFYAFGTCRVEDGSRVGILNDEPGAMSDCHPHDEPFEYIEIPDRDARNADALHNRPEEM